MTIGIKSIEYYLPERILRNEDFIPLGVDPIFMAEKIGITERHIAAANESVCDMAEKACKKLFSKHAIDPASIELLILCTQNPDYVLPTTACILQEKLGMGKNSMCFDINQGCSGYIYSLGTATALMNQFKFSRALVVTSEAYSKIISYADKTTATLFSDAAAATLLEIDALGSELLAFNFGTDGSGFGNLIVPVSGSRAQRTAASAQMKDYGVGISRSEEHLFMDGQEIMKFVFREVPPSVHRLLEQTGIAFDSIDLFVFHQANKYILQSVGKRMGILSERLYVDLTVGNTVSSTLPIAIKNYFTLNPVTESKTIVLSGFGVGYSWGSLVLKIKNDFGENL